MSGAKATRFTRSGKQLADPQVHTVVNAMSFEDKQRAPVLSASFWTIIGLAMLLTMSSAMFAHANSEASNSAAYQEVTVPLDPETKAVGGALYAQHCAACHDSNMVRAPQRYVLANVSPSTLLSHD